MQLLACAAVVLATISGRLMSDDLEAKVFCYAVISIEDNSVVNGDILLQNYLESLLGPHSTDECSNIVDLLKNEIFKMIEPS